MAPAWRASRTDVLRSLREESRATSARSSLRATLVATQVALSLVLLIGTGLFLRSLVNVAARPARLQRRPGGDGSGESRGRPLFTCTREGLL